MNSCVYFKFKSALDYESVNFDGVFISISALKDAIIEQKGLKDCEIAILNSQTGEEYEDDNLSLPKNSSVIIKRQPATRQKSFGGQSKKFTSQFDQSSLQTAAAAREAPVKTDFQKPRHRKPITAVKLEEDDEFGEKPAEDTAEDIEKFLSATATDWDRSKINTGRGWRGRGGDFAGAGRGRGVPNAEYVCRRCKRKGHFIQDCPTNGNADFDQQRRLHTTGIPLDYLQADSTGKLVLPTGETAVMRPNSEAFDRAVYAIPSAPQEEDVPDHLQCSLCEDFYKDAVLILCCQKSFCDECVRSRLVKDGKCPHCGSADVNADKIYPNKDLRAAVEAHKRSAQEASDGEPKQALLTDKPADVEMSNTEKSQSVVLAGSLQNSEQTSVVSQPFPAMKLGNDLAEENGKQSPSPVPQSAQSVSDKNLAEGHQMGTGEALPGTGATVVTDPLESNLKSAEETGPSKISAQPANEYASVAKGQSAASGSQSMPSFGIPSASALLSPPPLSSLPPPPAAISKPPLRLSPPPPALAASKPPLVPPPPAAALKPPPMSREEFEAMRQKRAEEVAKASKRSRSRSRSQSPVKKSKGSSSRAASGSRSPKHTKHSHRSLTRSPGDEDPRERRKHASASRSPERLIARENRGSRQDSSRRKGYSYHESRSPTRGVKRRSACHDSQSPHRRERRASRMEEDEAYRSPRRYESGSPEREYKERENFRVPDKRRTQNDRDEDYDSEDYPRSRSRSPVRQPTANAKNCKKSRLGDRLQFDDQREEEEDRWQLETEPIQKETKRSKVFSRLEMDDQATRNAKREGSKTRLNDSDVDTKLKALDETFQKVIDFSSDEDDVLSEQSNDDILDVINESRKKSNKKSKKEKKEKKEKNKKSKKEKLQKVTKAANGNATRPSVFNRLAGKGGRLLSHALDQALKSS